MFDTPKHSRADRALRAVKKMRRAAFFVSWGLYPKTEWPFTQWPTIRSLALLLPVGIPLGTVQPHGHI